MSLEFRDLCAQVGRTVLFDGISETVTMEPRDGGGAPEAESAAVAGSTGGCGGLRWQSMAKKPPWARFSWPQKPVMMFRPYTAMAQIKARAIT